MREQNRQVNRAEPRRIQNASGLDGKNDGEISGDTSDSKSEKQPGADAEIMQLRCAHDFFLADENKSCREKNRAQAVSEALTAGKSWMLMVRVQAPGSLQSSFGWTGVCPVHAFAAGFQNAGAVVLLVHDHEVSAVGMNKSTGFFCSSSFTGRELNLDCRRQAQRFLFLFLIKMSRVEIRAGSFAVFFHHSRRVIIGIGRGVTNLAVLVCGNKSCSPCILAVMVGHGPAQRVKMMSATKT